MVFLLWAKALPVGRHCWKHRAFSVYWGISWDVFDWFKILNYPLFWTSSSAWELVDKINCFLKKLDPHWKSAWFREVWNFQLFSWKHKDEFAEIKTHFVWFVNSSITIYWKSSSFATVSSDCIHPSWAWFLLPSETLIDLTKSGAFWLNELCLGTENIWKSMHRVYFFSKTLKSSCFLGI